MNVLLFGGTAEGRELAEWLHARGVPFTVCVATEYGETLLPPGADARVGRLGREAMEGLMAGYTLVIDATHPYAVEVTKNIREAAETAGVPCLRLVRRSDGEDLCHKANDLATAAQMLEDMPGNILLTTGSKELHYFSVPGLVERCFPRVLPVMSSLARCLELGFPPAHIICMQGPFSRELNAAMIHQMGIRVLVTKDTGSYGGFRAKADAAHETGCALLVVERPTREEGLYLDEIRERIKGMTD